MKTILAIVLLVLLYVAFVFYVLLTSDQLPARVATHFDIHGDANDWMNRSTHICLMLVMGSVLPLLVIGCSYYARFVPKWMLNLPNRNYWLAPERQSATVAYLFRQSFWMASLVVGLFIGIEYLIIKANQQTPPHLPGNLAWSIIGGFVGLILLRVVFMLWHFRRVS